MTMILISVFPGLGPDSVDRLQDQILLEEALHNLSNWKVVPWMQRSLEELERIALLKGLSVQTDTTLDASRSPC